VPKPPPHGGARVAVHALSRSRLACGERVRRPSAAPIPAFSGTQPRLGAGSLPSLSTIFAVRFALGADVFSRAIGGWRVSSSLRRNCLRDFRGDSRLGHSSRGRGPPVPKPVPLSLGSQRAARALSWLAIARRVAAGTPAAADLGESTRQRARHASGTRRDVDLASPRSGARPYAERRPADTLLYLVPAHHGGVGCAGLTDTVEALANGSVGKVEQRSSA
jgi:hypothetical protein